MSVNTNHRSRYGTTPTSLGHSPTPPRLLEDTIADAAVGVTNTIPLDSSYDVFRPDHFDEPCGAETTVREDTVDAQDPICLIGNL